MEHALLPPKGIDGADKETSNPHTFTQRCNFKNDCPSGNDEDGCPQFYSFEDCATPEACGWSTRNGSKELEWVVATADQVRHREVSSFCLIGGRLDPIWTYC